MILGDLSLRNSRRLVNPCPKPRDAAAIRARACCQASVYYNGFIAQSAKDARMSFPLSLNNRHLFPLHCVEVLHSN